MYEWTGFDWWVPQHDNTVIFIGVCAGVLAIAIAELHRMWKRGERP